MLLNVHPTLFILQDDVCEYCEESMAQLYCPYCENTSGRLGFRYCEPCSKVIHKSPVKRNHKVQGMTFEYQICFQIEKS